MKSYQIFIIRHGVTLGNAQGRYVGSTDLPVSKEGIQLLKKWDELYDYPGTPLLFSSPKLRCIQTCNIIYPELKPTVVEDLKEYCFGDWEGKTAKELAGEVNFANWLDNSMKATPPNGETGADFTRRICKAFEGIVDQLLHSGDTTAVIVGHGAVFMTLLSIYGLPHANPSDWYMDNGFGYGLRIIPSLWMRDKVVEVFAKAPFEKTE